MQRHGLESMLLVLALLLSTVYLFFAWKYVTYLTDTVGVKLEAHSEQLARLIELTSHARDRLSVTIRLPYSFGTITPSVSILRDKNTPVVRLQDTNARGEEIIREQQIYLPIERVKTGQYDRGKGTLIITQEKIRFHRIPGCKSLEKSPRTLAELAGLLAEQRILLHVHPSITKDTWRGESLLILPSICILPGRSIAVLTLSKDDSLFTLLATSSSWWTPSAPTTSPEMKEYDAYLIPLMQPIEE